MYAELKRALADEDRTWLPAMIVEPAFGDYLFEPEFAAIAREAGFPMPIRPLRPSRPMGTSSQ